MLWVCTHTRHITMGILPSALRASLRLFKIAPGDFIEPLVLGVRDYVAKNGFSGTAPGLSGGIDSALTLAIALDALGAEQVEAVPMPSHPSETCQKCWSIVWSTTAIPFHR